LPASANSRPPAPGTVNGNINFAAPNTGQSSISNTTVNGTVNYSAGSVQTIMNNLNTLSSSLGALSGTGTSVAINTSLDQTILASGGTSGTINGVNYRLFNVTSVNSQNGQNLIIKGDGSASVVLDVNTPGDAQFHGNILLQDLSGKFFGDAGYAGLFPDQLLINLYAGAALVGGDNLSGNNNGNNAHPDNIIYGTFLDPNGAISFVNTRITGRIFGGDSTNMQIVSGDTITPPPSPPGGNSPPEVPAPPLGYPSGDRYAVHSGLQASVAPPATRSGLRAGSRTAPSENAEGQVTLSFRVVCFCRCH
jgi:hypothetical protein